MDTPLDSNRVSFALQNARTQSGATLAELSKQSPLLLLFLRHLGCAFCREALADVAACRREIEESGVGLAFVHMGSASKGREIFAGYGLGDVPHASDPKRTVYQAFGLKLGNLSQLFSPKIWRREIDAAFRQGHGIGWLIGNGFQMPGVFLVEQSRIVRAFRHARISDRPDYIAFASGDRPGLS